MTLRCCWMLLVLLLARQAPAAAPDEVQFNRDIRPLLSKNCFACHGPDEHAREAELRLDRREGLFGQDGTGAAIVAAGDPAASILYQRITATDDAERMPPSGKHHPLDADQIDRVRRWIEQGAAWQSHWSFEPPTRPQLPEVSDAPWCRTPIDRFVLARLERESLRPSPPTDPVTLLRRLSFDLTGLPPTRAEVEQFVAATATDGEAAYQAAVERLLASPHYGERMAVAWLDLVRYADSCGYHSDVPVPISPYRDYVIGAFNDNLPFDRFTREQLAGDLVPEPTLATRVASGYNRLAKTTEEGGAQAGEYLAKGVADRVRTTAGVWLGLTFGCAECHDHKYDPVTTRDFYSLGAFFADIKEQGVYSAGGRDPEMPVPTPEQADRLASIDAQLGELEQQLAAIPSDDDTRQAERNELQSKIEQTQKDRKQLDRQIERTMVTVAQVPREMRILPRGNWLDSSGPVVEPALPAFLASQAHESRLTRLDLAQWLTGSENPLTARVHVNRLWKMFFGAGLARTLDDVGAQGETPSHPELLDWLAIEFHESGWDTKRLVRLLVTSSVYRQSSAASAELLARDPQNRLLARQSSWRLEAEFVRDQALQTSGLLVDRIGGPSVKPYQPQGYWDFLNFPPRKWRADEGEGQYRRGLYTHWQRTFLHPSLLAFDAPSREECTAQRAPSNTPKAALALLNDPTFVECARAFAARALRETQAGDGERIAWAWREALSRPPLAEEAAVLGELLAAERLRYAGDETAARQLLAVGQAPLPDDLPPVELAAWTEVARAILNLHESVSRN
ncbi:MAG: DUF1553 domain-containing protein [Pirellulales bacterium]|nr:DUF1553 domain-containing protein [Pirellulales bacterium]